MQSKIHPLETPIGDEAIAIMAAFLSFKFTNLDKAKNFVHRLEYGIRGVAVEAMNDYLWNKVHTESYPPYDYITRKKAYGKTFQSDRQRRWFWAKGGPAIIGNHRTDAILNSWHRTGEGTRETIWNSNPAAVWVHSNTKQAHLNHLVGWKTVKQMLTAWLPGAIAYAKNKVSAKFSAKIGGSHEAPGL